MAEFHLTNAVVAGMLQSTGLAESLGSSPRIRLYSGTKPVNADAALSGNTVLAELVCAATPISGVSDTGSAARATFAAIAPDSSADASGVATFWRLLAADGTTVKGQGDVATSGTSLNLNTTSITAGSLVSLTSAYIDLPEGGTY